MKHILSTTVFSLIFSVTLAFPVSAKITLDVPFTSQAPDSVWVQPWQDACEETSIFMVHRYYRGSTIQGSEDAKRGILEIFDMKHALSEESLDETASTMVEVINNFLPWSARVVEEPTIDMMKQELDAGRPVIIPAYAPALHNVYFRGYFPYHMLVLSGYDDAEQTFIDEDPGSQYGHDYRYRYATIMDAMHDFLSGHVQDGPKRAIFTSPEWGATRDLDGDKDGLSKQEEYANGTVPYLFDSDGDGFGDGIEVQHGYWPAKNEQAVVKPGALLISEASPKVYYYKNGKKHHVSSESVFYQHGWSWQMLEWVSNAMMKSIPEGSPLT